ncbi:transcriptional repressor CTCF-like protein [Favolaschia claudopus]|uniref:Transcriptional repressor CTCF-like protein n=1 Tax=Favolaschia claudopus TaxID=2862362 RepID=A0AAW0DPM3_9AGAR
MSSHNTTLNASTSRRSETDTTRRTCATCGIILARSSDLPRHMLTHAKNKEDLMYGCPFPECGHKTLQKSNLETHIRIHTNIRPLECPAILPDGSRCTFTTSDPSSLHRHKKRHFTAAEGDD